MLIEITPDGPQTTAGVRLAPHQGVIVISAATHTTTAKEKETARTTKSVNQNLVNQLQTRQKVAKVLIAVAAMFAINFFPVHVLPLFQVGHSSRFTGKRRFEIKEVRY